MQHNRVPRPSAAHVGFCLFLPLTNPRAVVLLRNLNVLMPEKNRDALNRHTRQEKFGRKGVAKAVGMAILNSRFFEEVFESALPVSYGRLQLAVA